MEPAFQDQLRSGQDTNKAMVTVYRHIIAKRQILLAAEKRHRYEI